MLAFMLRRSARTAPPLARARRLATFPVTGQKLLEEFLTTHSTLGAQFAERIGADEAVCVAIRHGYEQWDGKGQPGHLRGAEISLPARLVQLAGPMEVFGRRRGVEAARSVARRHRAHHVRPGRGRPVLRPRAGAARRSRRGGQLGRRAGRRAQPVRRVDGGTELDGVLAAMADLVDLKSPYLAGHSRGVANLAEAAARGLRACPKWTLTALRRAGLIHDLGRLGVSNAVWDKPGPLTAAEFERVRLHPYLTDRMLARVPALARSREIAARHHERLDGSGYPHGLTAASLTPLDRLLAAADVYHALTEPRPHRPAFEAGAGRRAAAGPGAGGAARRRRGRTRSYGRPGSARRPGGTGRPV